MFILAPNMTYLATLFCVNYKADFIGSSNKTGGSKTGKCLTHNIT